MSKFLITGMPRCRTAWLTAVLNAHGVRCYHDIFLRGIDMGGDGYGVADPAVALLTPVSGNREYARDPVVVIYDDDFDGRLDALGAWAGVDLLAHTREHYKQNFDVFVEECAERALMVNRKSLEDDTTVGHIIQWVSDAVPDEDTITIFQGLKIEEHIDKARELITKR